MTNKPFSKTQAIALAKVFALQLSAQAMLVSDGMQMEKACILVSAVMFTLPFVSTSARLLYTTAFGSLPRLSRS